MTKAHSSFLTSSLKCYLRQSIDRLDTIETSLSFASKCLPNAILGSPPRTIATEPVYFLAYLSFLWLCSIDYTTPSFTCLSPVFWILFNTYFLLSVNADWGADLEHSIFYVDSQDNGAIFPESGYLFENAWKNCIFSFRLSSLCPDFFHVFVEMVGKMVNDVCCEDLDPVLFCVFLGVCKDFDIEDKQASVSSINI